MAEPAADAPPAAMGEAPEEDAPVSSFWPRSDPASDERSEGNEEEDEDGELANFLPPFADSRNRALNKEVATVEKEVERTDALLEENTDRVAIMEEHLKNVNQELRYTQTRADATPQDKCRFSRRALPRQ